MKVTPSREGFKCFVHQISRMILVAGFDPDRALDLEEQVRETQAPLFGLLDLDRYGDDLWVEADAGGLLWDFHHESAVRETDLRRRQTHGGMGAQSFKQNRDKALHRNRWVLEIEGRLDLFQNGGVIGDEIEYQRLRP